MLRAKLCFVFATALMAALAAFTAQPPAHANPADPVKVRLAEDAFEELLGKFGPEYRELAPKIDNAIRTGTAWLISMQNEDGSFSLYMSNYPLGGTALCLLAVKKAMTGLYPGDERDWKRELRKLERREADDDFSPEDAARIKYLREQALDDMALRKEWQEHLDLGMSWLREKYFEVQNENTRKTYSIGIILMLLEAYHTKIEIENDGYAMGINNAKIPAQDLDWIRKMVTWLETQRKLNKDRNRENEVWRYPSGGEDHSCSQYAILGLKAAARMGVFASSGVEMWLDVVNHYLEAQDEDGVEVPRKPVAEDPDTGEYFFPPPPGEPQTDRARGWSYLPDRTDHYPTTGSMTTAALAAIIMAKSELYRLGRLPADKQLEDRLDVAINDGLCWLGQYFSVAGNPKVDGVIGSWHYYYLYGLERAGILARTEAMGEHFWYLEGAQFLVAQQSEEDGSWGAPGDRQFTSTAYAILFLKRATTPVDVPLKVPKPVITGGGNGPVIDGPSNGGGQGNDEGDGD